MKKILIALLILVFLVGCTKSKPATKEEPFKETDIIVSEKENKNKIKSPLTGIYIDKERLNDRPIAVMLDNYYKARPQAGLSEADIVYEVLAEGNITRYLAIIYTNKPKLIGPVRSARPYFLDKALEYDPLYVHAGGSSKALLEIKKLKMGDIDSMSSAGDIFWREKHKSGSHNLYTSFDAVMKQATRRKYKENGDFKTLQFNEENKQIQGKESSVIKFPYRGDKYTSEFRYNKEDGLFYRYVNNKPHFDEVSKIHLTAKNILVQYTSQKVVDSQGRLEMNLIGEGKGLYLTNGRVMEVKWKKPSRKALTIFYDLQDNEIKLNPGVAWYQIVPSNINIITE